VAKSEKAIDRSANTAGSRPSSGARNDDAAAGSDLSIEQLFAQPLCWRRGHIPAALQQHEARAGELIIEIDGSVSAAMTKAAKNLRTGTGIVAPGGAESYISPSFRKN
jgi:hypothetical protein